jgi:hypothetical protein
MPLNFHGYSIHRKERLKSLWQRDSTMSVWDLNSFGSYSYWFDVYGNRLMGQKVSSDDYRRPFVILSWLAVHPHPYTPRPCPGLPTCYIAPGGLLLRPPEITPPSPPSGSKGAGLIRTAAPPRVLPTYIGKNRIVQHGFSRYRTRTLMEWVQTHHQLLVLEFACVGRIPLYLY